MKRYNIYNATDTQSEQFGDWVKHSDVDALEASNKALREWVKASACDDCAGGFNEKFTPLKVTE